MRHVALLFLCILVAFGYLSCAGWLSGGEGGTTPGPQPTTPVQTLPTSLHGTASGMQWWYEQADGAGALFGIAYTDTGCGDCHVVSCDQCHADSAGAGAVNEPEACQVCHGRQAKEQQLGVTDVHLEAGMVCSDCHSAEDMHGDGTTYNSMLASENVDCEDCHSKGGSAVDVPDTNTHTIHGDKLNCDACHMSSAVTCYNCHFETLLVSHEKKPYGAFKDFVFLLNDDSGQVRAGTYQSVVYQDKQFVAFGPFHGHSVTAEGRGCNDCHGNERIQELNDTGKIVVASWNADEGKVVHTTGAIPFAPEMLELQFVTLNNGTWEPTSTQIDQLQYEFCTPLTEAQLAALGYSEGGEPVGPAATLPTSLHGTARGMEWWYTQPEGAGALFGIAYADTGCGDCHIETCDQCHVNANGTGGVNEPEACMVCHGRQAKEEALGVTDVHFEAGMLCSDCHSAREMHGDGTEYNSMLQAGAMDTMCENCHNGSGSAPNVPSSLPHNVHGNVSCDACHMAAAVTCYNCHLQTLLDTDEKKPIAAFKDFILLLNDADGNVRAGTYQSVYYDNKGFVAFGPFHGHSVMAEGRACEDCHANERMQELADSGQIVMTIWNAGESKVEHTTGVIPFVPEALEFQFVDFDGSAWGPVDPAEVGRQYEYSMPLTEEQLAALQFLPPQLTLPLSLHGTANGMRWWYEDPDGAGALFGVDYADTGCGDCHVETCDQCHANPDGTGAVDQPDACLACHGRIGAENAMQLSDVHISDMGFVCSDCHTMAEIHGDGTTPDGMFAAGGLTTECTECHETLPSNAEHSMHGSTFNCDACHVESVITCYNCHLETLLDSGEKKANATFENFVILMNGPDGRVRTGSYQAVVYEGDTFIAYGPYHSHTITPDGRNCADCHDSARITELNDTSEIKMTWWDGVEGQVMHTTGVVPFVPELFTWQFVDLVGEDWVELTTDLSQYQIEYCSPLTEDQLAALGVE